MKKRNEKTSKRIASIASKLSKRIDAAAIELMHIERDSRNLSARINFMLPMVRGLLVDAKSLAMSALTQAPDKK